MLSPAEALDAISFSVEKAVGLLSRASRNEGCVYDAAQGYDKAFLTKVLSELQTDFCMAQEALSHDARDSDKAPRDVPAGPPSGEKKRTMNRDIPLAYAVLDLLNAADRLHDIIDDAVCHGWGFSDNEGEEWPQDHVSKAQHALVKARAAVQTALNRGDYWIGEEGEEQLRDD